MSLVGEIIIGQGLQPVLDRDGPRVLFEGIEPLLHETDIAVGILGCSIGSAGEARSDVANAFRAPASLARGLAHAGMQYVSLASPHLMDYGPDSLEETLRLLDWYGVYGFGAGVDIQEARKPAIKEVSLPQLHVQLKLGLTGYYHGGQFSNEYADDAMPGLVPATWSILEQDLPAIKAEVDILIVWIHWGIVPDEQISDRQRLFAHQLIELGADAVIGQKSHIWQGMELHQGKPIFYSLSDLLFDTYSRQYSRTLVPQLSYEGRELREIRLVPIWLEPEQIPYQPSRLDGEDAQAVLREYQQMSPELTLVIRDDDAIVQLSEE